MLETRGRNFSELLRPEDRLIVALDFPTQDEARDLVHNLGEAVELYKIGLELFYAGGIRLAEDLRAVGKQVFIDAKLLDIGNTVEKATANIAKFGAKFLTVHGLDRKTLDAAVRGRASHDLKLLAVTVLTNLDRSDLVQQGIQMMPKDLVLHRAALAANAGIDGVVASGHEAQQIRENFPNLTIVTPGIRPAGADSGDQTRVMTPGRAISAGADYLVVGRPISQASDPRAAAETIISDIANAL